MTAAFALLLLGTLMVKAGLAGHSIIDELNGALGAGTSTDAAGFSSTQSTTDLAAFYGSGSGASSGAGAATANGVPAGNGKGLAGGAGGATSSGSTSGNASCQGTTSFDGHPVCSWIVPILQRARSAGWHGTVTSGCRTYAEQTAACQHVCGNPGGCPGTCAAPGTSNHEGCAGGKGAVDVTDYATFGQIMAKMGNPLHNALASDPVHFSRSGN